MRREWLAIALSIAAAMIAVGRPPLAAVKTQVICTEREPADAPVHFRFENGGTHPEVILDLDYSSPDETTPNWVVGRTYAITIDDDFENAAVGSAMYSARAECTGEGSDKFRLRGSQASSQMTCALSWAQDPAPLVKPWTRARAYTVQILEVPKKPEVSADSPPHPAVP